MNREGASERMKGRFADELKELIRQVENGKDKA